jgi:hypothetical protein
MNEELLQQAIDQLKMFKYVKVETVSVENTEYGDGTMRFSVEVIYDDNYIVIKAKD